MYQVIILHGSLGSPFENWIPWLSKKLIKRGVNVLAPQFPTYEAQNYNTWFDVLNTYKDYFDRKNTIFVTHSVSASFALKYLMQTQKHVKAFISVSGFTVLKDNEMTAKYHHMVSSFVQNIHLQHFSKYAEKRYQFYSDNDDYIETEEMINFGKGIEAENIFISGAGHFNEKSGYIHFEELYNLIDGILVENNI
jgi:uncharacterized protein